MITDYERNQQGNEKRARAVSVLGIGILMLMAYQMGLSRGRSDKSMGQYAAVSAQYQRLEGEYADMKDRCEKTAAQYSELKAQYDRIEASRQASVVKQSNQ